MPDTIDSMEELTASMQQLTAEHNRGTPPEPEAPLKILPAKQLAFSPEVDSFVQQNRDYSAATRSVSVGTY